MHNPDTTEAASLTGQSRRRQPVARTALLLGLAGIILVALIVATGDWRRRQRALQSGQACAELLQSRVGASGLLPLNLTTVDEGRTATHSFPMTGLPDSEARALRGMRGPVLSARSKSIRQFLGRDGRVVVVFADGTFRPEWVVESKYQTWMADQRRTAERRAQRPDGS